MPTSLKLPEDLKVRVDAAAEASGKTPHAFMVEAIEHETARAERYDPFVDDALQAEREMEETNLFYSAEDVFSYLTARAEGTTASALGPNVGANSVPLASFEDSERVFDFYARNDPQLALAQIQAINEAISILPAHPLVGRLVNHGLRELVISKGKTGFVAHHRFSPQLDPVPVLRIRHQRELGYPQV